MKKFFCVVPLQKPDCYRYEAVGNSRLQMEEKVGFPILTVLNGYLEQGDRTRVIAVITDNQAGRDNMPVFEEAVRRVAEGRGAVCEVVFLQIESDERVAAHAATFQKLIDFVEDDDELFACMTYGTKPTSTALMMAVQYAYRVKSNASIVCIVYGQVDRPDQNDRSTWKGRVYDMTALIQLDEIVRLLAARGDPDPKKTIDLLLSL